MLGPQVIGIWHTDGSATKQCVVCLQQTLLVYKVKINSISSWVKQWLYKMLWETTSEILFYIA